MSSANENDNGHTPQIVQRKNCVVISVLLANDIHMEYLLPLNCYDMTIYISRLANKIAIQY